MDGQNVFFFSSGANNCLLTSEALFWMSRFVSGIPNFDFSLGVGKEHNRKDLKVFNKKYVETFFI